ncbi:MAG: response regulator [Anaerolineae bacterium]
MVAPDRAAVHEALASLYDNVRLAQASLIAFFPKVQGILALDERAEAMRSLLLEALDSLRPAHRLPFGSPACRSYEVLKLRYLERMRIADIEDELSLGRRQVFRDLEEAEAKLAEVLASWVVAQQDSSDERDTLSDELLTLVSTPGHVSLSEVVLEAVAVVAPLAKQVGKAVVIAPGDETAGYVLADAAIIRQVLVQLLCCAVQSAQRRVGVSLEVGDQESQAIVAIHFQGAVDAIQERRLADAQRIAESLGMSCRLGRSEGGQSCITLSLSRSRPVSVLVVEDNPGAVELYRRYLSSRGWLVQSVSDPLLACEAARRSRPDVIVLDIMMPRLDGWSVLGRLRQQPETRATPVLICSIVEQPELGATLGATAYLTKPVSQGEFMAALRRCLGGAIR